MDVIPTKYKYQKTKIFLVFFSILMVCCTPKKSCDFALVFSDNKATALQLSDRYKVNKYIVRIKDNNTKVLGRIEKKDKAYFFVPVIPFTGQMNYEVVSDAKVVHRVPRRTFINPPKVNAFFPNIDTVPENLLKMYVQFNKPIQQSKATLNFIKVYNQTTEKEVSIFLPLENELWNKEKTSLTLWLDPGRIKQDLIPNKELGKPIIKGNAYKIIIDKALEDQQGNEMKVDFEKIIFVTKRDTQKPTIDNWKIKTPKINTKQSLKIDFKEAVDIVLANEASQVFDPKNELVSGEFLVSKDGDYLFFTPNNQWSKGKYLIRIESSFEDLVGNNLNRLFDTDLENRGEVDTSKTKELFFTVQ